VFVGAGNFLSTYSGEILRFAPRRLFGDARAQSFRLCLKIKSPDPAWEFRARAGRNSARKASALRHPDSGWRRCGPFSIRKSERSGAGESASQSFAQALLPFQQKIHLRAKTRSRFFVVKVGQKGIVFAIVNAAGVEAFRKDAGQG